MALLTGEVMLGMHRLVDHCCAVRRDSFSGMDQDCVDLLMPDRVLYRNYIYIVYHYYIYHYYYYKKLKLL